MSSKIHILLLIVYVFAPFLYSEGSTSVHPTLRDICKKTGNADLCISTIAPGFSGHEADASSALKEAIRVATTRFEEAKKLADKLAKEANTPRGLVNALNSCSGLFDETLFRLEEIPRAIDDPSDPRGLNLKLTGIRQDPDDCITSLHKGSTVKSPLDPVASELSNVAGVCLDIAEQLRHSRYVARTCKAKGTPAHVDPTLSKICKEIIHPDICVSTVAPLLKGGKADVVSVLRAEIQVAASKCNEATQLVDKLVKDGTTPRELVKALNACNEKFHSALKDLQATEKAIDGGDREVSDKIGVIDDYVRSCEGSLSKINARDSPISTVVSDLRKLTDNCHSLNIVMGDPEFAAPAATGSSSSSKAKGTAAQVHPTLSDLCKKTGKADLCISTIAPGFSGREADASSALKEAIRVATTRFEEAKKLADKLAQEANTPRGLVNALNSCSGLFDETLFRLEEIPRAIDDRSDPRGLNLKLTGIRQDPDDCITSLHKGSTVKSPLDPVASELSELGSLCLDISTQIPA